MTNTLQHIIEKMRHDNDACLQFLSNISEKQFVEKPAKGWSIAEIPEHVVLTEKMIFLMLSRRSNEQDNPLFVLGEKNLEEKLIQGREKKLQAPEALHPKGALTSRDAGEEAFLEMRHRYLQALQSQHIALNQGIHKHPFLGAMSIVDWLYFIMLHRQRHFIQAKETLQELF
jgi:hypothetical protein